MPQKDRPTAAQAQQSIEDIGNAFYDHLITDGPSQLDRITTIAGNDLSQQPQGDIGNQRNRLNSILQSYRVSMIRAFRDLAKADGVDIILPNGLTNPVFRTIREWVGQFGRFTGGTKQHVTARGWTRGSEINANGVNLYRLNVDRDGVAIDTGSPQIINVVSGDSASRNIQRVRIFGEPTGLDPFELLGNSLDFNTPLINEESGVSSAAGGQQMQNHRLGNQSDDTTAFAANTDVGGWTMDAFASWARDLTNLLGTNLSSLRSTVDNAYFEQEITSRELDFYAPFLPFVWVYPTGVGAGEGVDILWGDQVQTFDVGTAGNGMWNLLVPTRDNLLFAGNFGTSSTGQLLRIRNNIPAGGTLDYGMAGMVRGFRLNAAWGFALSDGNNKATKGQHQTTTDVLAAAATLNHVFAMMFPEFVEAYWSNDATASSLIADMA